MGRLRTSYRPPGTPTGFATKPALRFANGTPSGADAAGGRTQLCCYSSRRGFDENDGGADDHTT